MKTVKDEAPTKEETKMTIGNILNCYDDVLTQIIRVYKDGDMQVCDYLTEIMTTMNLGNYQELLGTKIKSFRANEVAIEFFI